MERGKVFTLAILVSFSALFFLPGCGKRQVIKKIGGSDLSESFSDFVTNVKIFKEKHFVYLKTPKIVEDLARLDQYWTLGVPRNIPDDRQALKENFMKAVGRFYDQEAKTTNSIELTDKFCRNIADWNITKQKARSFFSQGREAIKKGEEEITKGRKMTYKELYQVTERLKILTSHPVYEEIEGTFWEINFSRN